MQITYNKVMPCLWICNFKQNVGLDGARRGACHQKSSLHTFTNVMIIENRAILLVNIWQTSSQYYHLLAEVSDSEYHAGSSLASIRTGMRFPFNAYLIKGGLPTVIKETENIYFFSLEKYILLYLWVSLELKHIW